MKNSCRKLCLLYSRGSHVLFGRKQDLDDRGAVDVLLIARGRVLAAHLTCLVEAMRFDFPGVGPDKDLQRQRLVVTHQLEKLNRKPHLFETKNSSFKTFINKSSFFVFFGGGGADFGFSSLFCLAFMIFIFTFSKMKIFAPEPHNLTYGGSPHSHYQCLSSHFLFLF